VAGGSTQLHGVASDIVLPSLSDLPEYGEGALKNCLAYDEVPKARFTKWSDSSHQLFADELKRRSQTRVEANPEFRYVMEDMERFRKRLDDNHISLNEDLRRAEMNEDKVRKEARSKERLARQAEDIKIFRLTLDTVDKPNLQPVVFPKTASTKKGAKVSPEAASDADSDSAADDDGTKEPAIDPERDESLNILSDLVNLSRGPTTASASAPAKPVP
jgi:carboxyl-terminal processing protease